MLQSGKGIWIHYTGHNVIFELWIGCKNPVISSYWEQPLALWVIGSMFVNSLINLNDPTILIKHWFKCWLKPKVNEKTNLTPKVSHPNAQTNTPDSYLPIRSSERGHLVPSISALYLPLSLLQLQPLRLRADPNYSGTPTPPTCDTMASLRLGNVQMVAHMFSAR